MSLVISQNSVLLVAKNDMIVSFKQRESYLADCIEKRNKHNGFSPDINQAII